MNIIKYSEDFIQSLSTLLSGFAPIRCILDYMLGDCFTRNNIKVKLSLRSEILV